MCSKTIHYSPVTKIRRDERPTLLHSGAVSPFVPQGGLEGRPLYLSEFLMWSHHLAPPCRRCRGDERPSYLCPGGTPFRRCEGFEGHLDISVSSSPNPIVLCAKPMLYSEWGWPLKRSGWGLSRVAWPACTFLLFITSICQLIAYHSWHADINTNASAS